MEIFKVWRAEIEAELVEARRAVGRANDEVAAAVEAAHIAKTQRTELADAAGRLASHRAMANALRSRVYARDESLREADARLMRARGAVTNALYHVEDLCDALRQLDAIDPPPPADSEAGAGVDSNILVLA